MTDYVIDYFASIPQYNLKKIYNTDEFLDNVHNNTDFIAFDLNLKFDDLSIKYDVVTKIDNIIYIYLIYYVCLAFFSVMLFYFNYIPKT